uniref:Uncharacterized protein n=1 Tax=Rhizophora mucronata TaxID=61149 RepID=A0A2P2QJG6_RHIMU
MPHTVVILKGPVLCSTHFLCVTVVSEWIIFYV